MSNEKIILADYISYTNVNGVPTGHALKVLKEYSEWIQNNFEIIFAAHDAYLECIPDGKEKIRLPYHICEGINYSSFWGKIKQLWVSWNNINKIFCNKEYKYVWFGNIDIYLFFYLFFHKKKRKKVIITTYLESFSSGYQDRITRRVLGDIKLLIYSNLNISYLGNNRMYIPDYLYEEEKYRKYRCIPKKKEIVCVGTMGTQKELDTLIEVFKEKKILLKIAGKFSDSKQYERLRKSASPNIIIEDRYLKYEEYLELLGEAEYCILPYKKDYYADRTSGVVLESMFLDTIPISYTQLLKNWDIYGIGYDNLEELKKIDMDEVDKNNYILKNRNVIERNYLPGIYLSKFMKKISD